MVEGIQKSTLPAGLQLLLKFPARIPKSSSYGHQGDQSVPWQDPACFLIYDQGSQGQLICHTQVACLGGESDSFVQQSCVLAAHAATGTA